MHQFFLNRFHKQSLIENAKNEENDDLDNENKYCDV